MSHTELPTTQVLIDDWQTLVQAGDIVRMGWSGGGDHTTTVLSKNPDGSITVFDNADFLGNKEIINIHTQLIMSN